MGNIYEGVYSFESYITSKKTIKNKFSELITTTNKEYYGKGEVSFKSEKIVILLYTRIEEMILAKPTVYRPQSQ